MQVFRSAVPADNPQPTPVLQEFRENIQISPDLICELCRGLQFPPLPASEQLLILFTAELSQTVAYSSMRVYLSAVRHFHLENGSGDPLKDTAQLDLLLRGAKRQEPPSNDQKLPVTPAILRMTRKELERLLSSMKVCCNGPLVA